MSYLNRYLNWYFTPQYGVGGHGCSSWEEYKQNNPIHYYGTEEFISDFATCSLALGAILFWIALPIALSLDFHVAEFLLAIFVYCLLQVAAFAIDTLLHPYEDPYEAVTAPSGP